MKWERSIQPRHYANYDVSPGGEQFVMVHHGEPSRIILIQNWIEEVRARSGGAR